MKRQAKTILCVVEKWNGLHLCQVIRFDFRLTVEFTRFLYPSLLHLSFQTRR